MKPTLILCFALALTSSVSFAANESVRKADECSHPAENYYQERYNSCMKTDSRGTNYCAQWSGCAKRVVTSTPPKPVSPEVPGGMPRAEVTGTQVTSSANAVNTYYLRESTGTGFAQASCDAGHVLVGGGGSSQGGLQKSQPQGGLSTWQTIGKTSNAATYASAVCARSLPSNYYLRESTGTGFAQASCDAGHVLVGGGGSSQGGLQKSQPQGGLSTWQTIGMTSNAATYASAVCARNKP